jgi:predicted transcriptional regulator
MKVLLSIKPEFAEMIFSGSKRYEFRRSIFRNPDVKTIVVYASSPVQKVIGEFEIETIINAELENLWKQTK